MKEELLARARFQEFHNKGLKSKAPSPLKVKEVWHEGCRYVVCLNENQAKRDALVRETIIESLCKKIGSGDNVLVGNNGYRRYMKSEGKAFSIEED